MLALSSCEAEYEALIDAMEEGNSLRLFLADMTGSELKVIRLYSNNQGSIVLSKIPIHCKCSKIIGRHSQTPRSRLQHLSGYFPIY